MVATGALRSASPKWWQEKMSAEQVRMFLSRQELFRLWWAWKWETWQLTLLLASSPIVRAVLCLIEPYFTCGWFVGMNSEGNTKSVKTHFKFEFYKIAAFQKRAYLKWFNLYFFAARLHIFCPCIWCAVKKLAKINKKKIARTNFCILILFPTAPWCSYCWICFECGKGRQCFQSVQSGTLDLLNPVDSSDDQHQCD